MGSAARIRRRFPKTVFPMLFLVLLGVAGEDVLTLGPGMDVERELALGGLHRYEISLEAGHFVRLTVEQHEIDLAMTVTDADATVVTVVDSPGGRYVTETVSLLAGEAARFFLEIRVQPRLAGPGSYTLHVEEWREAAPADHTRIAAERVEARADQLYWQSTADSFAQALTAYGEALDRWREIGDPTKQGEMCLRLGLIHQRRGERKEALERFGEGLLPVTRQGDRFWQATLLNQKGLVLKDLGESAEALTAFEEALALRRELGQRDLEGAVYNNIGLLHHQQGELREARSAYLQALEIFRQTGGELRRQVTTLGNLGSLQDSLGEPLEALRFHEEQLAVARELGDRTLQATALNNLGLVRHKIGEPQAALESYSAALALAREMGDRDREAAALDNLGSLALELGEPEQALTAFGRALEIRRQTGARAGEAAAQANLGRAASALGRPAEAFAAYEKALEIRREIGDRAGETTALCHFGALLTSQGRPQEALEPLRRALELARQVGDRAAEALAQHNLGVALAAQGNVAAALAPLHEALRLRRAASDPAGEVAALGEIARAGLLLGDLETARSQLEAALGRAESLRRRIAADRLRSSYLASLQDTYETYIDVLMTLHERQPEAGFSALAFEASEKARARSLLDLLQQARVEIRRGADPQLLDEERRRRIELDAKAERQTLLLQGPHTERQAAEARRELEEALAAHELADAKLQAALPAYAGLVRPAAVQPRDAQELLDADTVLLEYSLGAQRSFVWAVTPASFSVHELPGRAEITAAAAEVHGLLGRPATRESRQRKQQLAGLGRMLLDPVAGRLAGKRLAIVAPAALQYIPFAALPLPGGEPVVELYEVVSLPSAAVLRELRHNAGRRTTAPEGLAIVADPVFQADDPRVAKTALAALSPSPGPAGSSFAGDVERLTRNLGAAGFQRLSWTRREAEAVAAQAGESPVQLSLDFQASLDTVLGSSLARFRRIHFATHGFLDDRYPELTGLVLSLVDAEGRPRNGFLRLTDVYNLELGADLVVLSGCQTALGREVRGEGLMGLTRGFFHAGATRIVASLWPVRDRATAELMERFYHALLREGQAPSAALRAAQLALRRDPRWRDPYYWAPFVVQGDW